MNRRWLVVAAPVALATALAALFALRLLPNPVLYLRLDLAALLVVVGIAASAVAALVYGLHIRATGARRKAVSAAHTHAGEERRRFVQRLDHELKNPLMAIRAGLTNLAESDDHTARQRAFSSAETQIVRLSRLVADLRKLAELEHYPLEHASVDMVALIEDAVAIFDDRIADGKRRLRVNVPQAPWPLPSVAGDYDLLLLALHNVLDNALKYSDADDALEVRAFENEAMVVVEVADTGKGITDADQPYVWEELYRGADNDGVAGSGLGLSLTRAIVERHDGRIALRSRAGQGTVVALQLPKSMN